MLHAGAARTRAEPLTARPLAACQVSGVVQLDAGCSAVLVHPRVLLYPAHCGGPFESASAGDQRLAIERCQSYPDGGLFGSDLGFCVLREPAPELSIVAPALGCEAQAITPGRHGWVVGFGATDTQPTGDKHVRQAQVQAVTEEISVSGPGFGACKGDSGGPLLIDIEDGAERALRVAGLLSASSQEACVESTAYFTPLWPFVAWVEAESGFDLSPCGEADGAWDPSSDCRSFSAALLDSELCDIAQRQIASSTCGPAAARDRAPSYLTKQQKVASCQSVFARGLVRTSGPLALTIAALCAAALRARARRNQIS
jgi:hypothetical protein